MKLLIISDIHANKEALNTVLSIPHDKIICLGDLVDYGPSPHECIDIIRKNNIETVKGNHDNAVATGIDCGCGYDYKYLSIATREYTWSQLDKNDINFLKKFSDKTVKNIDDLKLYFSHGSPRSMYEYIKPETSKKQTKEMIMNLDADFIFVGHSHIPLVEYIGKKTIINPGSVGQPRDGDNRASCALFDTISQKVEVIRCEYDVKSVYKKIQNNMLYPDQLIKILERGY